MDYLLKIQPKMTGKKEKTLHQKKNSDSYTTTHTKKTITLGKFFAGKEQNQGSKVRFKNWSVNKEHWDKVSIEHTSKTKMTQTNVSYFV